MTFQVTDHVRFDFAACTMVCEHCGDKQKIETPQSLDSVVALLKAFGETHADCKPRPHHCDIRQLRPGDYVRTKRGLHRVKEVWGVGPDGRLAKPSEGGFGCVTEEGERVSMFDALEYVKATTPRRENRLTEWTDAVTYGPYSLWMTREHARALQDLGLVTPTPVVNEWRPVPETEAAYFALKERVIHEQAAMPAEREAVHDPA